MEELECYNKKYKERLDEVGALGEIPDDLALEVIMEPCPILLFQ